MEKMKSAYEIALEKADKLDEMTEEEKRIARKEEIRPLLAKYYKEKIDADKLWLELKEKNNQKLYQDTQEIILDSVALRINEEQLAKRKEAILAIESLKNNQQQSIIEQYLNQIEVIQKKYKNERESIENMMEKAMDEAQMQMKPVQTQDGKTVMKLEAVLDEKQQKRFNETLVKLETNSLKMLNDTIEKIKKNL